MDHVALHLPLGASRPETARSTATAPAIDTRRGDALWEILGGVFGSKLVAGFGEECPLAWHRMIADLTDAELERGLYWIAEDGREWPPSASEFRALCRKSLPPRPDQHKALPSPRYPKEKALAHIARLKEILAGKNVPADPWAALR